MFKNYRQYKILDLIESEQITTQEEIAQRLNSIGIRTTQATVSRDLRQLGLVKTCFSSQKYVKQYEDNFPSSKKSKIKNGGIIEVRDGNDKIFVKTCPGCGRLAKQYLLNILGSDFCIISDDNSAVVFLFANQKSSEIIHKINKLKS